MLRFALGQFNNTMYTGDENNIKREMYSGDEFLDNNHSSGELDEADKSKSAKLILKFEEDDPLAVLPSLPAPSPEPLLKVKLHVPIRKPKMKKRKMYQVDPTTNTVKLLRDDDDVNPIKFTKNALKLRKIAPRPIDKMNIQPKVDKSKESCYKERCLIAIRPKSSNIIPPREHTNGIEFKAGSEDNQDEFDTFGKHVANQLRKLSTLKYIQAQEEIQSTLTKFQLNDFKK